MKTKTTTVRLSIEDHDRLRTLSIIKELSVNTLIKQAVKAMLKKEKK